jgi:tetratricopeptide (TPR) repeat protein
MSSAENQQKFGAAMQYLRAGRLGEAEGLLRAVLAAEPSRDEAMGALAQIAFMTGRGGEAVELLRGAAAVNSVAVEYRGNLGMVLSALGRLDEAIEVFRGVLAIRAELPEIWNNLGAALKEKKKIEEAEQAFKRALALRPGYADALSNLGVVLQAQDKVEEAIEAFSRASELNPQSAKTHVNLGSALLKKEQYAEAGEAYRQALAREAGNADALFGLGSSYHGRKLSKEAVVEYRAALVVRPDFPEAHFNLGKALQDLGELDSAVSHYRRAVELQPDLAEAVNTFGSLMLDLGRHAEAIEVLEAALRVKPDVGQTHHVLANVLQRLERFDEALEAYRRAMELLPDSDLVRWNRSLIILSQGKLREAWRDYELRRKVLKVASIAQPSGPEWRGENLDGKGILLHSEQGFGDVIQSIRYVPLVRERGGRVIVLCPRSLHRLLSRELEIDALVGGGETVPGYDVQCSLFSLPHVFDTSIETIPNRVPYVFADPNDIQRWRERLAREPGKLKVGLSWAGNPEHQNDRNRSLPLADFALLAGAGDITFVSLQKGAGAAQAAAPPAGMRIVDWTRELTDFADTAGLVANLDLVIAVDTAVAHLAGAMGKPTWILLATPADWRWMIGRADSPWYPTARLFRQERYGQWAGCIRKVGEELRGWARG